MSKRERALEDAVKDLGQLVSELGFGGRCSPRINAALKRARTALKMEAKADA